ncbi:hypothetical protein ERJ75_001504100 [Trypanosoma vivax]|nr:hypothetical protein ERJ75_001504100 [Trypanosoma vivax]
MRLCLFTLLAIVWCAACQYKYACSVAKGDKSNLRRCAARDMLLGWLNVTNKIAVRAEKVKRNVTNSRERANVVRMKVRASLAMANGVLNRSKGAKKGNVSTIKQALQVLESAVAIVDTFRSNADKAESDAGKSVLSIFDGYGFILRAAKTISGKEEGDVIPFENVLEMYW